MLDRHELVSLARVERAQNLGVLRLTDRVERAGLSVLAGGPVRRAARLTPRGRDVLAYARQRPHPSSTGLSPGQQLVELRPSQMTAVRTFTCLADELESPSALGRSRATAGVIAAAGVTFSACDPLCPCVTSKRTFWPSCSSR